MNEFTKEELEDLKLSLSQGGWWTGMNCINTTILQDKIQSLIDRPKVDCKHENITEESMMVSYCLDCGNFGI